MKSLKEYENIQEFFKVLDRNGMANEKSQLEFIINYIDSTEKHLSSILDELQNIRMELETIQKKPIKSAAIKTVDTVTEKVDTARKSIHDTKNFIKDTVNQGLEDFKRTGKMALIKTIFRLDLKELLTKTQNCFDKIQQNTFKSIDTLNMLNKEIKTAHFHYYNIGRILVGKEPAEIQKKNNDKGVITLAQKGLYRITEKISILSARTQDGLLKLDGYEQKLVNELSSMKGEKGSVKKALTNYKKEHSESKKDRDVQKER